MRLNSGENNDDRMRVNGAAVHLVSVGASADTKCQSRRLKLFFVSIVVLGVLLPFIANADDCSDAGYTVVYVNGILTSKDGADKDRTALENRFRERIERQDIDFITGYNESHLGGFGDLIQSISQTYGKPVSSFNLNEILRQMHDQIRARKILLVGHSQGTFYTNEIYRYLTTHGILPASIAVYNLATPANLVAGSGQYITSSNDKVIELVRDLASRGKAPVPLPANSSIDQTDDDELPLFSGHDFRKVYLAGAADRIVGEIKAALDSLSSSSEPIGGKSAVLKNGCFEPPPEGLLHTIEGAAYAMSDPAALGVKTSATLAYRAGNAVLRTSSAAFSSGSHAIAAAIGFAKSPIAALPPANKETAAKAFPIVKALYGSSLSQSDVADLLGTRPASIKPAGVPISHQNNTQDQAPDRNPPKQDTESKFRESAKSLPDAAQPSPIPQDSASTTLPQTHASQHQYQAQPFFSGGGSPPYAPSTPSEPALVAESVYSVPGTPSSTIAPSNASTASATSTATSLASLSPPAASASNAMLVGTSTMELSLSTAVASTTPAILASTTQSSAQIAANDAAPFGDSFNTYDFGNLYAQGLWRNNEHVWEVTDQGCMGTGRCLVSTGVNGINWKSGEDQAKGQWRLHFYAAAQFYPYYVGSSIYFGSAEHPEQASFQILDDIPGTSTIKLLDGRGNTVASRLALNRWHTFDFMWDMGSTTNCIFNASVDGRAATSAAVGAGAPADCYGNIFSEHAVGSLGLGAYYVGQGQFLIDNIEGGPLVNGCLVNCGGTTTPLTDSFDHFNDAGWAAPPTPYNSLRVGTFDGGSIGSTTQTASGNCHSGGCMRADGWIGGLGGDGWSVYQYLENGIGKPKGAFTVWAKASATSTEWSHVTGTIGLCEAKWSDCISPWTYMFSDVVPNDAVWHRFYVAWQPALFSATTNASSSNMAVCLLQDTTSSTACVWRPTQFPSNRGFDGLVLSGTALRPDLGDHLWFDDLEEI